MVRLQEQNEKIAALYQEWEILNMKPDRRGNRPDPAITVADLIPETEFESLICLRVARGDAVQALYLEESVDWYQVLRMDALQQAYHWRP